VDLRPFSVKLIINYLIIGGSKDILNSKASIGKQIIIIKNARSITTEELEIDHYNTRNQQIS